MSLGYQTEQPTRDEIDALPGATVLQFGTDWCGYCRAAERFVAPVMDENDVRHVKVEDGKGRALGRSYKVKLWPTLVFLKDGEEVARVVRPTTRAAVREALSQLEESATTLS